MKIELFLPSRRDEIVEVLTSAFYNYETMRYFIDEETPGYELKLSDLMGYLCDTTYIMGSLALGIIENGEIVAAVLVGLPEKRSISDDISKKIEIEDNHLKNVIGDVPFDRLEHYEEITEKYRPDMPHYYIDTIGVSPDHRGKGYAKALLDKIKFMVIEHQNCNSVCLFTESQENVKFYKYMGYEVFVEKCFGPLRMWGMALQLKRKKRIKSSFDS